MLIKRWIYSLFIIVFAFAGMSCERTVLFVSNKKIDKMLQGTWNMTKLDPKWSDEVWKFEKGDFTATISNPASPDTAVLRGKYLIANTSSSPYFFISKINGHGYMEGQWAIIEWSDDYFLASRYDKYTNGMIIRQFNKID